MQRCPRGGATDPPSTAGASLSAPAHKLHGAPFTAPHGLHHGWVSSFDLSGALRRIRRLADVSQRDLAEACGISQSAVAQAESGRRDIAVGTLTTAAAVAGLRIALVDDTGVEVGAMAADAVRDLSGRRFPAHLDTLRSDEGHGRYEPRRDRPETSFTYSRDRDSRDAGRRARGTPADHHPVLPGDSPAARLATRRLAADRARAAELERRFLAGEFRGLPEPFECACPDRCDDLDDWSGRPVHSDDCPCSCDVG